MNAIEAAKLLTVIAGHDGRDFDENTARAWALSLHDVALADALPIVPSYFRSSTGIGLQRLMPVHILNEVEAVQDERIAAAFRDTLNAGMARGLSWEQARIPAHEAMEQAMKANPIGARYIHQVVNQAGHDAIRAIVAES